VKRFLLFLVFSLIPLTHASALVTFSSTTFGAWQVACNGYFSSTPTWATAVALSTSSNMNTLRTNWDVWTQLEIADGNYFYPTMDAEIAITTTALETPIFNIPIHNSTWGLPAGTDTHIPEQVLVRLYNFCYTTVSRYKSVIHYWEIWNEADNPSFWNNETTPNPLEYLGFIRMAYQAIKQADPTATVVLGGIAFPYNHNSNSWLDGFLSNGGGNYFDVMNIHIYSDVGNTGFNGYIAPTATWNTAMGQTLARMTKYGITSKPIWITELNSTGSTYINGNTTAQFQAQFLMETFTQILSTSTNIQKTIWHTLEDCNGQDFGLYDSTGGIKPVSTTWQIYQNQLLNYQAQGQISNNGFNDFEFTNGGTTKFVVWPSSTSASGLSPGTFSSMAVTDMFGVATTTYTASNVPSVVFYSSGPVFITGIP
jgi:putative glycosyl hydrolase